MSPEYAQYKHMLDYENSHLSHEGDHTLVWVSWGKRQPRVKHDPSPLIRHWRKLDIKAFRDHMNKWKMPHRHDPLQIGADIKEEVAHYVRTHQQVRHTDKEEQGLAEEAENHPGDERRKRKLYAYQGKKATQRADKALCRFRRTVQGQAISIRRNGCTRRYLRLPSTPRLGQQLGYYRILVATHRGMKTYAAAKVVADHLSTLPTKLTLVSW